MWGLPENGWVRTAGGRDGDVMLVLVAIVAGALVQIQAGMNGRLAEATNPLSAAAVSLALGFVVVATPSLIVHGPVGVIVKGGPWWMWCGGALGACALTLVAMSAPQMGALNLAVGLVAGQILMSIPLDRWGALGFDARAVSPVRILGAALVLIGVMLVVRFQ